MANISNINDFFIVDSVGLKAAVGADLANGNGSPYVGTDFTVVGRDASSPVANLWLSNFTHKSYILISDNSSNFIIRDSGAGNRLTIDSSGNSTFAGTITGPGATFNTAVDTVGLGVYTSGESTTPNVRFGRDDSQYVGFKIADRVNSIIFRQDETTGDFTSELNLWSSTTGNSFFKINKSDNTGGSSSTWLAIKNGNVGIGTASPTSYDADSDNLVVFDTANAGITIATSDLTGKSSIRFSDGTTGSRPYIGGIEYLHSDNSMRFDTSAVERLRIDGSGNVGIGVTPEAWSGYYPVLQIGDRGSIAHWANDSISIGDNWYYASGNKRIEAGYAPRIQLASATGKIYFDIADTDAADSAITWSTKMIILPNGNVGIGTTSPDYTFTVLKSITNDWLALFGNTYNGAGNGVLIDAGNGSSGEILRLRDRNGNSKVSFLSNGNVGIGTTAPQAALTVAHDLSNGGDATGFRLNAATSGTSNTLFGGPVSSGDYAFFQSYKEGASAGVRNLNLNPIGGNVGIGTDAPGQKLEVAGLVKHQGLDMTAGVQVDQTTSITKTLTGTANVWRPTGIDGTDIPSTGSYLLQVFSDDHSGAGPANYSWFWTGTMSWYAGPTNNNVTSEIYLNGCGHHTNMVLELRTKVNYNSATIPFPELEWKSGTSFVNSPGWIFKFRRLM